MRPRDPSQKSDASGLDQAFYETDDPELRAFSQKQTGRKVAVMVLMIAAMVGGGAFVGWAIFTSLR